MSGLHNVSKFEYVREVPNWAGGGGGGGLSKVNRFEHVWEEACIACLTEHYGNGHTGTSTVNRPTERTEKITFP